MKNSGLLIFQGLRRQYLLFPLLMVAITLVVQFADVADGLFLRYQREEILSGQLWRLFSGHFVHASLTHFALNTLAFLAIFYLFKEVISPRLWWLLTLISMVTVAAGLLLFNPEIHWYVGLSGVLHGLFAAGALFYLLQFDAQGFLYLILLLAKLLWEQLHGPLPSTAESIGVSVVTDAHLYGAIGGLISATLLSARKRFLWPPSRSD